MAGKLGRGVYATSAWRSLRAACKAAAGGLCADCGRFGFSCHHKIPLYLGGPELPGLDGVVWLCRACHKKRHPSRRRAGWDTLLARLRAEVDDEHDDHAGYVRRVDVGATA